MRDLVGKVLRRPIEQGDFFFESDLVPPTDVPRIFSFERPWGLPVRFHDWQFLAEKSNPDFLEFHLSYRDLDLDFTEFIPKALDYSLVVHSPDLFHNDLILDLASQDKDVRSASSKELQRVVDLTSAMAKRFRGGEQPKIVVSLGGSSLDSPWPMAKREQGYELVISELEKIESKDVEILAQTLPPFPWYLGGQRYCNLFVDPRETVRFSKNAATRICFDVAHTKLACTHSKSSFEDASHMLLPVSGHTHLVDAAGVDGEGLQIDEGDINWRALTEKMNELTPSLSFIPEIWQGHIEGGLGFWTALIRLESHFNITGAK
jgi:N-acetylneuraminate synthase